MQILNSLVYIPSGIPSPELEILLAKCQEIINSKKNLNIIVCAGGDNYACSFNIYSQKNICFACKNRLKNGLKNLKGNYNLLETPLITNETLKSIKVSNYKIKDKNDLINKYYKNIDLGLASYSSYLNISRDLNLDGFFSSKSLEKILRCTIILINFFFNFLIKNNIHEIFIYNGRQNQNRPLFRIANILKIKVNILEHTIVFNNPKNKNVRDFENNLPNDISYFSKKINNHVSVFSKRINKYNADKYFKLKQVGVVINDKASYVKAQKIDSFPSQWNFNKKNIVFFTSSDDEYAVLADKYKNQIYKNQADAIFKIINSFTLKKNMDYHLWIRMHPNLSNVKWNFNSDLIKLENLHSNIHIIKPASEISSYKIISLSEKFITYNSTTALEAVYMNKPTILLGRTYFEKLGCFYIPKSHHHLTKLIFKNKLFPKKKGGVITFVSYWIESGIKQKFFAGNLIDGFRFNNRKISYSLFYKLIYQYEKFLQIYLYGLFNYYMKPFINFSIIFKNSMIKIYKLKL